MHTSVPLQARGMSASGVHLPRRHRLRQLCSSVDSPAAHAAAVLSAVACMSCRSRPPMLPRGSPASSRSGTSSSSLLMSSSSSTSSTCGARCVHEGASSNESNAPVQAKQAEAADHAEGQLHRTHRSCRCLSLMVLLALPR